MNALHQNTSPLKIAVAGCCGRMGLTLVAAVAADKRTTLIAGSERDGFDENAVKTQLQTVGCRNLFVTSDPDNFVEHAQAIIDFTTPEATLSVARSVAKRGGVHIIGTTGWSQAQQKELEAIAKDVVIVQSGNFSLGVNLLEKLIEEAARKLDETYDIEIFEMHHKHKKDAPSGTALMFGNAAAKGRGVGLSEKKVAARDGITGERKAGDIGFSVARGGDVVGIHNVIFAGSGEVIELKHQGFNRDIYATGAIHAALWAHGRTPGIYSMKDVLGL